MVTYSVYEDGFHGAAIPVADWPYYASRAEDQLEQYKRVYCVTEPKEGAESMAICAMAEALYSFDAALNAGNNVNSASIGSVSVSYAGAGAKVDVSPAGQARELYRCAKRYLNIYRGCG